VARKKPRREGSLPTTRSTTRDEAARKTASHDVSEGHSPPAADGDIDDTNTDADPVMDTQPNTVATGRRTLEEDAKLTRAVANTSKKKYGKEYRIDWNVVAAMVPGRMKGQCRSRWQNGSDSCIDQVHGQKTKTSS
jgi:hypothetical protein